MRHRAGAGVLAAGALVVLAGCSGSPDAAPDASPSAVPTPAASSAASSPSLETLPAAQCLTGTWRLVRFVGASDQTYGTGQGGDVTVRFADGGYTLQGAGEQPVTVTLAGQTGELRVDGDAQGTWTLDGATARFEERSASGSATLRGAGQTRALTMDQVSTVVGLEGEGQVACTAQAMTVTLATVRLELART